MRSVAALVHAHRQYNWVTVIKGSAGGYRLVFTTLSDAAYFLQVTKSAQAHSPEQDRAIRVCVLLSWIAVESFVSEQITKDDVAVVKPKTLLQRISFLLARKGATVDAVKFRRLRSIRNMLTHPGRVTIGYAPPPAIAQETFQFCVQLMQDLYHLPLCY